MPHLTSRSSLALILLSCTCLASADDAAAPPVAEAPLAACFEPGTPQAEMDRVADKLRGMGVSLEMHGPEKARHVTRWSQTATDGGGLVQGQPTVITWSYLPDGYLLPGFAGEPTSPNNLHAWMNGIYGDFDTWHALYVQVFERWSEKTGMTYVYEPNDDGASFPGTPGVLGVRGDVRIAAHSIPGGILAYNWFPNLGDMVIDSGTSFYNNTSNNSLRLRNVLAHEAGHGIGQAHVIPTNGTKLMEPFINLGFDGPTHDEWIGANRFYGDHLEGDDAVADANALGGTYPPGVEVDEASNDAEDEEDWFRFDALTPDAVNGGEVRVELRPVGFSYSEGPQGGGVQPFDSRVLADLRFDLFESDGSSLIVSVDDVAQGNVESTVQATSSQELTLRVSGTGVETFPRANNRPPAAQLYDLLVETTANPVTVFGPDPVLECGIDGSAFLDGSASFDPDGGSIAAYGWTTDCAGAVFDDPTSPTPILSMLALPPPCPSICQVTLTVTDDEGQQWTESQPVRVEDTIAPNIDPDSCGPVVHVVPVDGDCFGFVPIDPATGLDACDPSPTPSDDAPPLFPRGETLVTHSLTDDCGNAGTCVQVVSVFGQMDCFAANCSKIETGSGAGDGKIRTEGTFRTCDGDDVFANLTGNDRVRLLLDGYVAFDRPWSSFAPQGPGYKYSQGDVTFTLKRGQWKFSDRGSDITAGDLTPADGVTHELELGFNLGAETLQMDEKRTGKLESCRHGQSRIDCR